MQLCNNYVNINFTLTPGVIEIDEMAAIFPVEERFTNALKERKRFTKEEFDRFVTTNYHLLPLVTVSSQ